MTKQKRLIINIIMGIALALFSVAGILVYFNYYPRVTIYFMDEYEILNSVELKKGNMLPNLPRPEKTGSTFEGWYTDEELTDMYYNRTAVNGDMELFAKFEKIVYTLTFKMPGDDESLLYDTVYPFYNDRISIPTGEEFITYRGLNIQLATYKPGYNFVGWTLHEDGSGDVYTSTTGFYMVPENSTLYPKWEPKSWEYTFKIKTYDNPESEGIPTIADYASYMYSYTFPFAKPENPIVEHQTFVAWYFDADFNYPVDFANTTIGTSGELILNGEVRTTNFTLYGKFKVNEYKISFNTNAPQGITVLYEDGYLDDIVTYYNGLVTNVPDHTGMTAVLTVDNSREMYKFMGWNTRADGEGYVINGNSTFRYEKDEDMTLYAMWERYYYLTFYYKNERLDYYTTKAITGDTVNLQLALKQPNMVDDITEPGRHFAGWTVRSGDSDVTDVITTYTLTKPNDVAFNAEMANNMYYINIIIDAGSEKNPDVDFPTPDELCASFRTSFTNIPSYTRSVIKPNNQMQGWVVIGKNGMFDKILTVSKSGVEEVFTMNEANINYAEFRDGRWTIDITPNFVQILDINYNVNIPGSTITIESDSMLKGQGHVTLKNPTTLGITRDYYTFEGWALSSSATEKVYSAGQNVSFEDSTTLYAVWKPVPYTLKIINRGITGHSNNESATFSFDVEHPLQLFVNSTTLNVTVPTGYHFEGLTTSSSTSVDRDVDYPVSDEAYQIDVTMALIGRTTMSLYTVIKLNTYTVTYIANDEEYYVAQDITHGSNLEHPTNPTLVGATFKYWKNEEDRVIANGYVVSSDMTLTAVFEKNTYTVSLVYCDPAGTTLNNSKDFEYNHAELFKADDLATANNGVQTYEGYTFVGWYESKHPDSSMTPLSTSTQITGRTVYYTIYSAKAVEITYNANGGEGSDIVVNAHYDDQITLPTAETSGFTREGMSLYGWMDGNSVELGKTGDTIKIKYFDTVTIYAIWKNDYTLTYDLSSVPGAYTENVPSVQTYMDGTEVTIPNNIVISAPGKDFNGGWIDLDTGARYAGGTKITITKNTSLQPVFGSVAVTATYVMSFNGSVTRFGTQRYEYGDEVEFLELTEAQYASVPVGYTVDGWCLAPGEEVLDEYIITQNITFYLKLTREYTITYNINAPDASGSIPATKYVSGRQTTLATAVPTRPGYTCIGWDIIKDSGVAKYTPGEQVIINEEIDITLYAQYEKADIMITLTNTEGSQTGSLGVKLGQQIYLPAADGIDPVFVNPGYRLVSWKDSNNVNIGNVGDQYTVAFTSNQTWYAVWAQEYTVTYTDGTDAIDRDNKVIVGEEIELAENTFEIVGKYFDGWQNDGNTYTEGEKVTITNAMISAGVITFTAKFEDIKYNVTYIERNAEKDESSSVEVVYGNTHTAPSALDTANYRFLGWGTALNNGVTLSPGASTPQIYQDTIYYAQYVQTYTVTFTDGTTDIATKYDTGTVLGEGGVALERRTEFVKTGKMQMGYQNGATKYAIDNTYIYTAKEGFVNSLVVTSNLTLTAVYADYHTLSLSDGTTTKPVDNTSGNNNYLPYDIISIAGYFGNDTFAKEGFSIAGYSLTNGGTTPVEVTYTMPNANTVLYVIWGAELQNVVFVPNNGEGNIVVPTPTGSTVSSQTVTKNDYEFAGWYVQETTTLYDFSTPISSGGITLEAHWTKLYYVNFDLDLQAGESASGNLPIISNPFKLGDTIDIFTTIDRAGYSFVSWEYYYGTTLKAFDLPSQHANLVFGTDLYVDDTDSVVHDLTFKATWTAKSFGLTITGIPNANIIKRYGTSTWEISSNESDTIQVYCAAQISVDTNKRFIATDINGKQYIYTISPTTNLVPGGWRMGSETEYMSQANMPASNLIMTPVLEQGTMTITYTLAEPNSGTFSIDGQNYTTYTQRILTESTSPAVTFVPATGYRFVSWYYETSGGRRSETFTTPTIVISNEIDNCTVYASATLVDVSITFTFEMPQGFAITTERFGYAIDSEYIEEINYTSGTTFTTLYGRTVYFLASSSTKLTPQEYYVGSDNHSYTSTNSFNVNTTEPIAVRVVYGVKKSVITYYDLEVSSNPIGTQTDVDYGAQVGEIKFGADRMQDYFTYSGTYYGRRFAGWYQDQQLTIPFTTTTTVNEDMNVYAKRVDLHRLTFVDPVEIQTTGSVPELQYAISTGTLNFSNTGYYSRRGYYLDGWTVTYGSNSVNVSLADGQSVSTLFGTLNSPTDLRATAIWHIESYNIYFTTNSTTSEVRGHVIDKTDVQSRVMSMEVSFGDTLVITDVTAPGSPIARRQIAVYHDGQSEYYSTVIGEVADESWKYKTTKMFVGEDITVDNYSTGTYIGELTETYTIDDLTNLRLFVSFHIIGNHLLQSIDVHSDYAFGNVPVDIELTIVNYTPAEEDEVSYVDFPGDVRISASYTNPSGYNNGDNFVIAVPRYNTRSYVRMKVTAREGFYLVYNNENVNTYTIDYKNIGRHGAHTIVARLKTQSVTIQADQTGWNGKVFGTVAYSYLEYSKDANGFIINDSSTRRSASGSVSYLPLTIPYFTSVEISATANAGRTFAKWNASDVSGGDPTYVFSVNDDAVYSAFFTENNYTYTFKINGVVWTTVNNLHTDDDITSKLTTEIVNPTPAEIDAAPYNLTGKWFDGWELDDFYNAQHKIICGASDMVINAILSDAYIITITNKLNGEAGADSVVAGTYTRQAQASNYYTKSELVSDTKNYQSIIKVKGGTNMPTLTVVGPNDGYLYNGTQIVGGDLITEPTIDLMVNRNTELQVLFANKVYTLNFIQVNGMATTGSTWQQFENVYYNTPILSHVSSNPDNLDTDPQYAYYFTRWVVYVNSIRTVVAADSTVYSLFGNLATATTVTIIPEYDRVQKYRIVIMDGATTALDTYLFTSNTITFAFNNSDENIIIMNIAGETQSYTLDRTREYVYISDLSNDNGRSTSNIHFVKWQWNAASGSTPAHRTDGGNANAVFTMGNNDMTMYITYVDRYSVTLTHDEEGTTLHTLSDVVADTQLSLSSDLGTSFHGIANEAIAPHYNVLLFTKNSSWIVYDKGQNTTDGEAYKSGQSNPALYVNPDASVIVDGNISFTYVRRTISKLVSVYAANNYYQNATAQRSYLVKSGMQLLQAPSTDDSGNVLPYILSNTGNWDASPGASTYLSNSIWGPLTMGHTFVGYYVYKKPYNASNPEVATFYTAATISQLVMNATDNLYIVCDFKVNNYNYTITGDLPYYKDGDTYNHSVLKITYTTDKNAGSRNERELLEEHVTYIKQLKDSGTAHNYYVKTDTGDYVKVTGTQYTISVAYKCNIKIEITESINSVYNECWYGVPRPRTGVSGDSYDIIDTSTPSENDAYDITALPSVNATKISTKITSNAAIKFFFNDRLIHLTLDENRDGWLNSDGNSKITKWSHSNAGGNELNTSGYSVVYGSTLKLYTNNSRVKFDTYNWKMENRTTDGDSIYWALANSINYRATGYETASTYDGVDATETLTSDRDLKLIVKRIYYIYFEENVPLSDYTGAVAYMPSNLSTTATAVTKEEYFHMYGKSGANYVRPSLTGYTFQGWDSSATGASPANLSIANTVDSYHLNVNYNTITQLTFFARWSANPVTVNYVIKVMDPDGVNDVTSQISDVAWTASSQTACYDDLLSVTHGWRNNSSNNNFAQASIAENIDKNVYINNAHLFTNIVDWTGGTYLQPKYFVADYSVTGPNTLVEGIYQSKRSLLIIGEKVRIQGTVTVTMILQIQKYIITIDNSADIIPYEYNDNYSVRVPYGTTISFPTRATPSTYAYHIYIVGQDVIYNKTENYHYYNPNHFTISYNGISGYTPERFSNINVEPINDCEPYRFDGMFTEVDDGEQVTSFTVTGDYTVYSHWSCPYETSVNLYNPSYNSATSDDYTLTSSTNVTVDGITYTKMPAYISYYLVDENPTSTISFGSTHPWYCENGKYYYLSNFDDGTVFAYLNNSGMITDNSSNSMTFNVVSDAPDISSTIAFKPGVSVVLNSNDGRGATATYTSVGSTKAELDANFSGIAEGENLFAYASGGHSKFTSVSTADWYYTWNKTDYDQYFAIQGVSTVASTITNWNTVNYTSNTNYYQNIPYSAATVGSTLNLYAIWKTRQGSEAYFTASGDTLTAFSNSASELGLSDSTPLVMPQYVTFANGGKRIMYFHNLSNSINPTTVVISPSIYSSKYTEVGYNGTGSQLGVLSTNLKYLIVSTGSYMKCGANTTPNVGGTQAVNGYFDGRNYATANILYKSDYSEMRFIAGSVTSYEYSDTNVLRVGYIDTSGTSTSSTSSGASIIANSLKTICPYVAKNNTNLRTVNLEKFSYYTSNSGYWGSNYTVSYAASNVTTIAPWAFYGNNITALYSRSITNIGTSAFSNCSNLTRVCGISNVTQSTSGSGSTTYSNIGAVSTLGSSAFSGCSALTQIGNTANKIDMSSWTITYIPYRAFYECTSLKAVTLPSTLTSISDYAFNNCSNMTLSSMTLPSGITSIGDGSFANTSISGTLSLPNALTYVGPGAFYSCSGITGTLTLGSNLNTLERWAFGYTGITRVDIYGSLTCRYSANQGNTFYGCNNLSAVHLYTSYAAFPSYAFGKTSGSTKTVIYLYTEYFTGNYYIYDTNGLDDMSNSGNYWYSGRHAIEIIGDYNKNSGSNGWGTSYSVYIYTGSTSAANTLGGTSNVGGYQRYNISAGSGYRQIADHEQRVDQYIWKQTGYDFTAQVNSYGELTWEGSDSYRRRNSDALYNSISEQVGGSTYVAYLRVWGWTGKGCFTEDTWIDVWDEKRKKFVRKRAKDVKYTDLLRVWNFDKGCFDVARPLFIQKSTKAEEFTRIHFSDGGYLDIVGNHSVFNAFTRSFRPVGDDIKMPIGTPVFKNDGSVVTITGKETIKGNVTYTNIITYHHMNVFANGILTSTPMNNRYFIPEGTMKWQVNDDHCQDTTLLDGVPEKWIKGLHLDTIPDKVLRNIIAHTPGCHNMREWLEINKFSIQKPKE